MRQKEIKKNSGTGTHTPSFTRSFALIFPIGQGLLIIFIFLQLQKLRKKARIFYMRYGKPFWTHQHGRAGYSSVQFPTSVQGSKPVITTRLPVITTSLPLPFILFLSLYNSKVQQRYFSSGNEQKRSPTRKSPLLHFFLNKQKSAANVMVNAEAKSLRPLRWLAHELHSM